MIDDTAGLVDALRHEARVSPGIGTSRVLLDRAADKIEGLQTALRSAVAFIGECGEQERQGRPEALRAYYEDQARITDSGVLR